MILSIDPGSKRSAGLVIGDDFKLAEMILDQNEKILPWIGKIRRKYKNSPNRILLMEEITTYGTLVGKAIFATCRWEGRFIQEWKGKFKLIYRNTVKAAIAGSVKARDFHIRRVLIERFGRPRRKKDRAFLYGIKRDLWSALAIAIYWNDKEQKERGNATAGM